MIALLHGSKKSIHINVNNFTLHYLGTQNAQMMLHTSMA
jgi:hypothetical protein